MIAARDELTNFIEMAGEFDDNNVNPSDRDDMVRLICGDCQFYDENEQDLECSAFKLASFIFQSKLLRPSDVAGKLSK